MQRKRERRSAAARVIIPPVENPKRRERCLADPETFLRTYGKEWFYNPFVDHHRSMMKALHERAVSGGDKAVAAPRGDGKTKITAWMVMYILLNEFRRNIALISAIRKLARNNLFRPIKKEFAYNTFGLVGDFPEISACVLALEGAPSRAAKQHVDGQLTHIIWSQEEVVFPCVPGSPYGGCSLGFFGLDSAIRGPRFDFAVIDDPETKQVANNIEINMELESKIDGDVAGLAYPNSTIPRVVLTTIQNRHCASYRMTDRQQRPTFAGERHAMMKSWPDERDMWDEYIAMRQKAQADGDKDGTPAVKFYKANRKAMEEGAVIGNPYRFDKRNPKEISAIQAFFNRISDWGLARVLAELQNDPEEEETDETLNLTAGRVASRISGYARNILPPLTDKITVGLDIGKYYSHWVKVAWFGNAVGTIIDYGVMETPGMRASTDPKAIELALLSSLLNWRTDILAENPPDFCLIDSGDYTSAIYQFVREVNGNPFAACKGWDAGRFRMPTKDDMKQRRAFDECWAGRLVKEGIWLYNLNGEHWKHWLQMRFVTATFDDQQQFNDGSLSLFSSEDRKEHLSFSHHVVAEERQERFVEGKGLVRKWVQVSRNNHWLDALGYACVAAGCLGIKLIARQQPITYQPRQAGVKPGIQTPSGRPFVATR